MTATCTYSDILDGDATVFVQSYDSLDSTAGSSSTNAFAFTVTTDTCIKSVNWYQSDGGGSTYTTTAWIAADSIGDPTYTAVTGTDVSADNGVLSDTIAAYEYAFPTNVTLSAGDYWAVRSTSIPLECNIDNTSAPAAAKYSSDGGTTWISSTNVRWAEVILCD